MKKILGYLVMVCCISVAKAQEEHPGAAGISLEKAIRILKARGVIPEPIYDKKIMKLAEPVHVSLDGANDSLLLHQIFAAQPFLKYKFIESQLNIFVKSKDEIEQSRPQFAYRIRGIVLNDSANPLPGASIQLRSGKAGIATQTGGDFTIEWSIGDTLDVSYVNYRPRSFPWRNSHKPLVIQLQLLEPNLDVAVVRGYTTRDKANTAGVSQVKVTGNPGNDVLKFIQENVSGILAPPTSGLAGTTHKFQFRGPTSLGPLSELNYRASNSPLFVVNGIPWAPALRPVNQLTTMVGEPQAPGLGGVGFDPFFTINPLDIETVTVLKDAEATTIYGARGANGVILITTKKGTSKAPKLTVTVSYGAGQSLPSMDVMNTEQYLAMRREAFNNDNLTPTISRAPDLLAWDPARNINMKDLLLSGTANSLSEHFSFSQGDSLFQVLVNGGYSSQTSALPNNIYGKRWSLLADAYYRSKNRKLKTGITASYGVAENKWLTENIMYAMLLAPNAPLPTDSMGNLNWKDKGVPYSFSNPLSYFLNNDHIQTGNASLHTYLQYRFNRKLRFESSVGYQQIRVQEKSRLPARAQNPDMGFTPTGTYKEAANHFTTWSVEPGLHYTDSLWQSVLVQGVVGAFWSSQVNDRWARSYTGYTDDELLGIPSAAKASNYVPDKSKYLFLSTFARARFNYKDKYFLSLTVRRDGSSRFGPKERYANFGAVGAGYMFWQQTNKDGENSYAKLRASYGASGNDQIGDYAFLNTWNKATFPYQGIIGIFPNGLNNPYYRWEVTRKLETAIELRLRDIFGATITAYRNRSRNQAITYLVPQQTGFGTVAQNFPAIIQNTGIEVDAVFKKQWDKFMWCGKLTLAIPQNKLVRFDDLENSSYAKELMVGQPLNSQIVQHYVGISADSGLYTIENPTDRSAISMDPLFFGGMRNLFHYKQFELSTYFEFRKQQAPHYLYHTYNYLAPGTTNDPFFTNVPVDLDNRWRAPGDEAQWQQVSTQTNGAAKEGIRRWLASDAPMTDASFIRMKNVQLTYIFPAKFCKKRYIKGASVYTGVDNLFTITPFKGADPELQTPFSLPLQKTFTVGLQVTL